MRPVLNVINSQTSNVLIAKKPLFKESPCTLADDRKRNLRVATTQRGAEMVAKTCLWGRYTRVLVLAEYNISLPPFNFCIFFLSSPGETARTPARLNKSCLCNILALPAV